MILAPLFILAVPILLPIPAFGLLHYSLNPLLIPFNPLNSTLILSRTAFFLPGGNLTTLFDLLCLNLIPLLSHVWECFCQNALNHLTVRVIKVSSWVILNMAFQNQLPNYKFSAFFYSCYHPLRFSVAICCFVSFRFCVVFVRAN